MDIDTGRKQRREQMMGTQITITRAQLHPPHGGQEGPQEPHSPLVEQPGPSLRHGHHCDHLLASWDRTQELGTSTSQKAAVDVSQQCS